MLKFLYATSEGAVGENPENLPKGVLSKLSKSPDVVRVAYDESENKAYVQDESTRRALSTGSEASWHPLNEILAHIEKHFGGRFVSTGYGDPPGSETKRKLSAYRRAWADISRTMTDELGVAPEDVDVIEESKGPDEKPFSIGKSIRVNKDAFRTEAAQGDVDYQKLGQDLASKYLSDVEEIMKESDEFRKAWKAHLGESRPESLFAMSHGGKTKIMRAGEATSEAKIRQAEGLRGYSGPIVVFSYDADGRRIVVKNYTLGYLYENPSLMEMASDIKRKIAKAAKVREADIVMSFDPSLARPFVTTANRYRVAWAFIRDMLAPAAGIAPKPITVVELPIRLKHGVAALIMSPSDLDKKADGATECLARHNLNLNEMFPFILASNESKESGTMARGIVDAYSDYVREVLRVPYSTKWIESSVEPQKKARMMTYMIRMGMTKSEAVDFFAPKGELDKRSFYRKLAAGGTLKRTRLAWLGGINDWWHIGSQEQLNEAEHTNGKPSAKPFNLKTKKLTDNPASYEGLLRSQHDKELGFQKATEQLLGESRV